MIVIPKKDLSVVDPALKDTLPPEGRDVGNDNQLYWHRREADGSVEVVPASKEQAARDVIAKAEKKRADEAKARADAEAKAKAAEAKASDAGAGDQTK